MSEFAPWLNSWIPVSSRLPDVDRNPDKPYEVAHVIATDGKASFPAYYARETLKRGVVYRWHYAFGDLYEGMPIVAWTTYPRPSEMQVFCYAGLNVPAFGLVRAKDAASAEQILKERFDGEEFYLDEVREEKFQGDGVQPLVF